MPVVATGLGKTYDRRAVLNDASFSLEPGTVTLLLGRNGAGKSTLIRLLAGLVEGTGNVTFAGLPLYEHDEPHRVLGVDLGTLQMHPGRTVGAHLRMLARHVPGAHERIESLVGKLGLEPLLARRPGGLSTGMRRSVAIVSALLADPSVLVLDEPINGVEVAAVRTVKKLLRDHADRGGTILIASHILAEAERITDRVLVLESGRIVAHESIIQYLDSAARHHVEVRTDEPHRLLSVLAAAGHCASLAPAGLVVVTGSDSRSIAVCASDAGVLVLELVVRRSTLADVFLGQQDSRANKADVGGVR